MSAVEKMSSVIRDRSDVQSSAFSEFMRDAVGPCGSGVHW